MQQRVNNLWLSDQLIEAARQTSRADRHNAKGPQLASKAVRHRRRWQQLATALLLIGSAAFSYLAWSQSDVRGLRDFVAQETPLTAPSVQENVRALRIQNRELQLRIAALQEAMQGTAP